MLLAFGALRLGFLAYFLSHPVISGFITGSAVLIAVGQLKHILGVKVAGSDVLPGAARGSRTPRPNRSHWPLAWPACCFCGRHAAT